MEFASIIQNITVYAIPLLFAITLHEAAHAFAARYFGDNTAYMMGRMTLNPIKHIDPVWTIAVPLFLVIIGSPFVFGAAKPVPVNFGALRNPKRDSIWVALAGPAANLAMMVMWAIIGKITIISGAQAGAPGPLNYIAMVAGAGILVNALLMVFNMFPELPLDGGRVIAGLLPNKWAFQYSRLEPYGMFILIALMISGVFNRFLTPLVDISMKAVYSLIGIS